MSTDYTQTQGVEPAVPSWPGNPNLKTPLTLVKLVTDPAYPEFLASAEKIFRQIQFRPLRAVGVVYPDTTTTSTTTTTTAGTGTTPATTTAETTTPETTTTLPAVEQNEGNVYILVRQQDGSWSRVITLAPDSPPVDWPTPVNGPLWNGESFRVEVEESGDGVEVIYA